MEEGFIKLITKRKNKLIFIKKELKKKFLEICNDSGMNLVQKEINEKLIYSYEDKLNNFLTKLK